MRLPNRSLVFFRDEKGQICIAAERWIAALIVVLAAIYLIFKH